MKKYLCLFLAMTSFALSEISFNELTGKVKKGEDKESICKAINDKGLGFDVTLEYLKKMKKEKYPTWLIDFVVEVDNKPLMSSDGHPRRFRQGAGSYSTPYNAAFWFDASLFYGMGFPFHTMNLWPFSPYYYYAYTPYRWYDPYFMFYPSLAYGRYGYYYDDYFWGYPRHYYPGSYTGVRGNRLTRNGYRNSSPGRVIGTAVRRGGGTKANYGKATRIRSSNSGSRGTVSRSSVGGTRSSAGARSSGGGAAARRR